MPTTPGTYRGDRVHDHRRRDFTAGKDEISDRDFCRRQVFDHSFVDAFVPAADQNHLFRFRKPQRFGLIESAGLPRSAPRLRLARVLPNRFNRLENRFRLENHSFAAAERPVVDRAMPIRGEIPQIVDSNFNEALFSAPPDDSKIERAFEELREDRDDVECSDISLVQIP